MRKFASFVPKWPHQKDCFVLLQELLSLPCAVLEPRKTALSKPVVPWVSLRNTQAPAWVVRLSPLTCACSAPPTGSPVIPTTPPRGFICSTGATAVRCSPLILLIALLCSPEVIRLIWRPRLVLQSTTVLPPLCCIPNLACRLISAQKRE